MGVGVCVGDWVGVSDWGGGIQFTKEIPLKIIRNKKKSIMKFGLKNTLEDRHCEGQF